ncbi:MAG: DUF5131 family protein [Acholeplasma sp.]|nr:DUF5131 family protein [Acholeplasma sp.]
MRWDPWRGCKRVSEGCKFCYIHKGDYKRGVDTSNIVKTKDFYKPIERLKNGNYKMKSGLVYVCFSSDFLIAEADSWREEVWQMIKARSDCKFLFLTKRIERFNEVIPSDWNEGYDNVIVAVSVENQKSADYRLPIFNNLAIKHKIITVQPLIESISISKYLKDIEMVVVGGESDVNARTLNYDWVLSLRDECIQNNTSFEFRQCGTNFLKDGVRYRLQTKDLIKQAKKANIDYWVGGK